MPSECAPRDSPRLDIPVADLNPRELEQELVPEWRAKYLDYKVRLPLHYFPVYRSKSLTMYYVDWQEESEGGYSRPPPGPSKSSHPILPPAGSSLPWRSSSFADALQHRQTPRCNRFERSVYTKPNSRQPAVGPTVHAESKDRATTATNSRVTILGERGELWQYYRDATAAWARVRCRIL